jgi:membrane fusion protein, multidrug efflux system
LKKLSCLILLLASIACNDKTNSSNPEVETTATTSNIAVNTTLVTPQTFNAHVIANGVVEAAHRSELRFKTGEQLAKIYVTNGRRVNQGTLLANLDNQLLKNAVDQAQINLNNASQKLLEEKIKFGYGSKASIDSIPEHVQKTLYQLSGYSEAKNRLENATILYEQTLLKAPFSGTVANLVTKEGNFITSAEVFCTLFSQDKLDVVFQIMENELPFVEVGQAIEINPFAVADKSYTGSIIEINPLVSREGLVRVKAKINNSDTAIFDGMNVRVFINKPIENLTVIPKEALVLRSNREVVFTVQNGLSKWNYVKIAQENYSHYALSEGINPGDTIIISNNMNLAHDADVTTTFIEPIPDTN